MEALGALAEYGIYWSPSPPLPDCGAISDSDVRPGLAGWNGLTCGTFKCVGSGEWLCGTSCGMPNTHHKDSQLRAGRFLSDS